MNNKVVAACWLLLTLAIVSQAAEDPASCPAQPAPRPSATFADAVEALRRTASSKDTAAAAAQALELATQTASSGDQVAHALAWSFRARALTILHSPEVLDSWTQAEAAWRTLEASPERIEALLGLAVALGADKDFDRAKKVSSAIELAKQDRTRSLECANALHDGGNALDTARYTVEALQVWGAALEIREHCARETLELAKTLNNLGSASGRIGNRQAAEMYFARARDLKHRLAPESATEAATIRAMGRLARQYGDFDLAKRELETALAIAEKVMPEGYELGAYQTDLVEVNRDRGDLAAARHYAERALAGARQANVGVAERLANLGVVLLEEGDLAQADLLLEEVQSSLENRPAPELMALVLTNRSLVALRQADYPLARRYAERALELWGSKPAVENTALAWSNRGSACANLQAIDAAKESFVRAIEIYRRVAPGSQGLVVAEVGYAHVLMKTGDLAGAETQLASAFERQQRSAAKSLNMGEILSTRSVLADLQGDPVAAETYQQRAADILHEIAPGSIKEARLLGRLGERARRRGELDRAESLLGQSFEIIRRQGAGIRSDERLLQFGTSQADVAQALIATQLARGETREAMETLEAARAQALVAALSERRADAALTDVASSQEFTAAQLDFANSQRSLERAVSVGDPAQLKAARARYIDARTQFESASSRLLGPRSVLATSRPLEELLAMLPSETAYVAFAVHSDSLVAFVVDGSVPERSVVAIPIDRDIASLAEDGRTWSDLLNARPAARPAQEEIRRESIARGRFLFETLFRGEVGTIVLKARRVIVAPDDALWDLPYAALVTNAAGAPKYFGLEKSIVLTPSLSVLALEKARSDRAPKSGPVLVVGDPRFTRHSSQTASDPPRNSQRSSVNASGRTPVRLASSRKEAVGIASLYDVTPLLDAAATESEVRRRAGDARIIHLATHGYFRADLPMSSGVLLAVPSNVAEEADTRKDGALQAWEFMNDLRLQAELVVLSACESGRGEKVPWEGILGLTRALQVAGANGVVATHWRVDDHTAADLMIAFHRYLRLGTATDESLRLAMTEIASKAAHSSPRDWAGYFFVGNPWFAR